MSASKSFVVSCGFVAVLFACLISEGWSYAKEDGKLRVCIVEGRSAYKKTLKFCPLLEATSNIECVIGVDRLDCVRKIQKGTAHFGVFSSEDLVAARWASVEILVTNEMRFHDTNFEYEVVAVVDNEAGINSVYDLKGAKLCHPGHGMDNNWTEILANYFESLLVPKSCDSELSLTEDRIKSSAKFFGPSCKAGPWVPDPVQDRLLKSKYNSLCSMCYDPYRCSIGDKHWGRRGTLYCLTSGGGDVSWARLDDVKSHFGFSGLQAEANPEEYSLLCPDGHLQPLNTTHPCVWVAKPWPAIAARRSHAAQIQALVSNLSHDDANSWENALLSLLESYHVTIQPLDNTIPIDDYLDQATGFQSAYSFPECNPPRSIVYCTTSIIQHVKCSWLQEAAQVYGVAPNLQCVRSDSLDGCMDDTMYQAADVVLVDQDSRIRAQRDYKLQPVLYEFAQDMHERYATVAVVKRTSSFEGLHNLKGRKACFPSFEGAAHLSVLETIHNLTKTPHHVEGFFSRESCVWNPRHGKKCADEYRGDEGALKCLLDGGDVAFVSSEVYRNFTLGTLQPSWSHSADKKSLKVFCPFGKNPKEARFEFCHLHWTPRGHLMIHNATLTRRNEIFNSLREMDKLFGKKYTSHTAPFTMYGPFDRQSNILFRDNTDQLRGLTELQKDKAPRMLEHVYDKYTRREFFAAAAASQAVSGFVLAAGLVVAKWIA